MSLLSEQWSKVTRYAKSRGANIKVVGDFAYRSPRYSQGSGRGRMVVAKVITMNKVVIWDSKEGLKTLE